MTIQAKALVRLTGIILTLFLLTTIAAKAQAGAGDLGSTVININNDGPVVIDKGGTYTITGNGQTGNTIKVDLKDGGTANITIEGVDILKSNPEECPFNIIQGTVKLTLVGNDNILQAGDRCAALQVSKNSKLVITKESTGKLTARGGYGGAGIGGSVGSSAGSITISGGTVEATGGGRGAGIGGGSGGSGGSITISGGKVTTEGNIGDGGSSQSPATGKISGGTIVCKSISPAFTISGGSVHTKENTVMSNGKVMAVVKGSSEKLPANAKVTSIKIGEDSSYGSTDVYTDGEGKLYLYIPQDKSDPVTLTIEGIANPLPASREYDITKGSITITAAGDYAIVGGETPTGNAITVNLGKKDAVANITIDGVKITAINYPFDIIQGTVHLTLSGKDNILQAGSGCAALQVSANSELLITKESKGKLTATGGFSGAGIGGGAVSHVGSITIAGGTVVATGVDGGAGIGGGSGSSGGSITIEGGKITTEGNIGDGDRSIGPATGKIKGGTIVCKSISPTLSITGGSVRTEDNSVDKDGKVMAVVKGSSKELPANSKVTSITIGEETYNWTDVYTDKNGMLYLYLQQDQPGSATVTIEGLKYTANASREYNVFNDDVEIQSAGDYIITGNSQETNHIITVELPSPTDVANITIEGVDIKTGDRVCPFNIIKGTVNLTLVGKDNELQAGMPCAALQVSENSKLLITGDEKGKLTATGGSGGAGIGGAAVGSVGSITIAGGTVEATGGSRAADIGGGDAGTISYITIAGGTVMATGGYQGASIGGSNESEGIINISGGTVMANANIGNSSQNQGSITGTISGGTIVCGSITSTFTISGGSVHSKENNVMNDGKGMAVIKGLPANAKVKSITIDNDQSDDLNDVYTDGNGLLYLYIPKDKPVPLSLTMTDREEYSASYVAASDKYLPLNPGANASLVQKTNGRNPVLFRNQNGGIIEMDGGWKDMPTVGSLVELKIKSNSVLNYNKLEGISKEDLNVKFTGKVKDNGEADCILTYTISFNMPNHDVCISLFDKLLVEKSIDGGYEVELNKLTITKPGEYTLKGAYAFLSDEEKKEINPSEVGVVFSVAVENGIGDVTLHLDGVSLMSNTLSVPALSCGSDNKVVVVPDGDNYLEGGYDAAGINKGPDAGELTIKGPGRLEVKGGANAAGIGGNDGEQANNIKIAGGTIVVGGNIYLAGIGSGDGASTATGISITGGSVNATVEGITDQTKTEVTFPAKPGDKVIQVQGLDGYKLLGMNLYPKGTPSKATLYLWLPSDFDKEITINGYSGEVKVEEPATPATLEAIIIDTNKAYNPNTHKDKSITIAPNVTFTIDAADASVIDLTIEPGGKLLIDQNNLLIDQQLEVQGTFAVQRNVTNKWTTFCSPVDLTLLNGKWANDPSDTDCLYLKSGYTSANDQKWTLQQSIKANTPYLLASEVQSASSPTTFYAQRVTLQGKKIIDTMNPSDFDNNLLFRANTSLTKQSLKDIYTLNVDDQKLILHTKDYPLQPFEAFFVASPATMKKFRTFSLGGSSQLPTGIAKVENDNFKIDNSIPGTLTFENQGEPATVTVVNASGEIKFVYTHFAGRKKLYGLSTGVYFIRYDNETSKVIVK